MNTDRFISRNKEKTAEIRESAKKKDWKKVKQLMKKTRKKKNELLERLGIKTSVLEQERKVFQKEKADLVMLIENDEKVVGDLNSTAFEREAAETRIEQREAEREWVSARLEKTERDLGLEDRRSLREKNKRDF